MSHLPAEPSTLPALPDALAHAARTVEAALDTLLPLPEGPEARLAEAMRYAALGGGKRLRAFLVIETASLFAVSPTCAARVGGGDRDAARLFAGARRPAGDGRRRSAPRQAQSCTRPSTRRPRSWPATPCRPAPSRCWPSRTPIPTRRRAAELVVALGAGRRRARHGGRADDRHAGRGPARWTPPAGHPAAGAEDRPADPVQRRSRRDPRPRRAGRSATCWPPMGATSAPRSRSPTTCWTPRARTEETGKTAGKDAAAGKATMVAVLGVGAGAGARRNARPPGRRPPGRVRRPRRQPCVPWSALS